MPVKTFRAISLGLTAFVGLALSGCETNADLGRQQLLLVSDSDLQTQALQAWSENLKTAKISRDPTLNRRIQTVGVRIVKAARMEPAPGETPWEYVLFDNDEPNAFVIPGRKVGINSGLFKIVKNDDQLAAVIGHETGHVIAHHAAERASQQIATSVALQTATGVTKGGVRDAISNYGGLGAQLGILLPYSRRHESEADRIGVDLMAKAGYHAPQAVEVWKNMIAYRGGQANPEFLSTHPSDESRIKALRAYIAEKGYK